MRLDLAAALLDALDEPALLVERSQVVAANRASRAFFGEGIVGQDVRLAIRQPVALDAVLAGQPTDVEFEGLAGLARPWRLSLRVVSKALHLVRLTDRSTQRAAERMRVDFVANASHELRTPLATILGYAETLADDGDLPSAASSRFGATIRDEARRMLRIIEDLMSLSRIEADRFIAPSGKVDLAAIAKQAAGQLAPLAERRHCALRVDAEDGLPPVVGDPAQLLQVVDNLIANAIRYGCGPDCPDVEIRLDRLGDKVRLAVRDRGEGIPADHLPRLTERFYRVDSARSRESGGTGLGLSIVKHIIERHRGTMEIWSRLGQGTEVRIWLPTA